MSTLRRPPAIPAWLLRRLVSNDALVGDLTEEFRRGRSAAWYWRQVVTAIVVGRSRAYGPSALAVLGLVILYRVANHLPAPGTRAEALAIVGQQVGSTTLAAYDTHTGGNLSRVTWLALGILPYVTVSIVLQSLALAWWRMKVRWINDLGGASVKNPMSDDQVKLFAARMRGTWRSTQPITKAPNTACIPIHSVASADNKTPTIART